ncbi:hypothetical protein ACHAWF_005435, partial [Thalassiosira exigua]
ICNLPDLPVHVECRSLVAVIVGRTSLVVANAGDSCAVLCRTGGLTKMLSFDHKPLQNGKINRIMNAGGFKPVPCMDGNLNLSCWIGDLKYKQVPGISPTKQMVTAESDILRDVDKFIVLGCDGICDCLSNKECINKPFHEIGTEMLDEIVSADPRALEEIGVDSMTITIIDLFPYSRPYNKDCS